MTRSTHRDDPLPESDGSSSPLLTRLAELERQVLVLRRDLAQESSPRTFPSHPFQALIVSVGSDLYAIPVSSVREIVRYVQLTRVAEAPARVCGAINLRGEVLPVVDGHARFGHTPLPPRLGTGIVLLASGQHQLGLVVDRVLELVELSPEMLAPATAGLTAGTTILALATFHARVLQVVDVDSLLSAREWQKLERALSQVPAPRSDDPDQERQP